MKNNLVILLLVNLCLLAACSKNANNLPGESPGLEEVYEFDHIVFTDPVSDDAVQVESFPRTGFQFSNSTSVAQTAMLNTEEKASSAFNMNAELDSLLNGNDTNYVQVPVSVGANGQFSFSEQSWPLVNEIVSRPVEKDPVKLQVAPYTTLIVKGTITQKVIKADYVVILKGQQSGTEKQITGSWMGIVPVSEKLDYTIHEIK